MGRARSTIRPIIALIEAQGQPEEKALFHVMQAAEGHAREHVEREDFEAAMRALAELRPAVDAFFDKVTVNAEDPALRANRLKLLNMLRQRDAGGRGFFEDRRWLERALSLARGGGAHLWSKASTSFFGATFLHAVSSALFIVTVSTALRSTAVQP